MQQPVRIGMEATERVQCLDFLRGFFVFLALWQHFAAYINFWYVDFYGGWSYWGSSFAAHSEMVGKQIPADLVTTWFAWFFTPWVSQIYLFLAAFNLGKREGADAQANLRPKLIMYTMLFVLFTVENLIVAPNIGESLSLYPLQTWMLILIIVLLAFSYLGEKGVWFLLVLSFVRFLLPLDDFYSLIESNIRSLTHEGFEIDARPEYFLSSASLGLLLGRAWWQGKTKCLWRWLIAGIALWLTWLIFGDTFHIVADDIFATEHDQAETLLGTMGIHGIELLVVTFVLLLKFYKFDLNIPLFNWIGRYSLLVFFLHRIVFLKVIMPFRVLLVNVTGIGLSGFFIEFWIYALLIVFLAWIIKKTSLFSFLQGKE